MGKRNGTPPGLHHSWLLLTVKTRVAGEQYYSIKGFGVVFCFSLFVLEACCEQQKVIVLQRDGLSSPPNLRLSQKVKGTLKHRNKIQCIVFIRPYTHMIRNDGRLRSTHCKVWPFRNSRPRRRQLRFARLKNNQNKSWLHTT